MPIISIFTVSLVTLAVFGPLGAVISDGLAAGYDFVHSLSPIAAGLVLGATIQLMVLVGVHWSFILIAMNNIALNGEDTILALIGPAIFAQAGAGLAVLIKTKGEGSAMKKFRSIAVTGIVSAILGVTEPVMYGVNLPKRKPMTAERWLGFQAQRQGRLHFRRWLRSRCILGMASGCLPPPAE